MHLFDEPQFNTQDGYIGFMLDFFRRLRAQGRLVFLCLHPNEPVHLDILAEVCERFVFVHKDDARASAGCCSPTRWASWCASRASRPISAHWRHAPRADSQASDGAAGLLRRLSRNSTIAEVEQVPARCR